MQGPRGGRSPAQRRDRASTVHFTLATRLVAGTVANQAKARNTRGRPGQCALRGRRAASAPRVPWGAHFAPPGAAQRVRLLDLGARGPRPCAAVWGRPAAGFAPTIPRSDAPGIGGRRQPMQTARGLHPKGQSPTGAARVPTGLRTSLPRRPIALELRFGCRC